MEQCKTNNLKELIKEREMLFYLSLAHENKITGSIIATDKLMVDFNNPALTIIGNSGPIKYEDHKLYNIGRRYIFEDANLDFDLSKIRELAILKNYSDIKLHLSSSYYIDNHFVGSLTNSNNYCYKLEELKNPFK